MKSSIHCCMTVSKSRWKRCAVSRSSNDLAWDGIHPSDLFAVPENWVPDDIRVFSLTKDIHLWEGSLRTAITRWCNT